MRRPPDPQFLDALSRHDPSIADLALQLRKLILEEAPDANESIYHVHELAIWFGFDGRMKEAWFCHVTTHQRHVNLGFPRGAELPDPNGVLIGEGKTMRHIKFTGPSDLQRPFAALAFLKPADGLSARATPSSAEAWLARTARGLAIPTEAKQMRNPLAKTPTILADGLAHWADHCANCHANDGSGDTAMGKGMYPPAPDMREPATQELSDGELFYIIENGIRLTGMPAWGGPGHDSTDSWKLVHFIRHLSQLSFEERREMERLNPKGPHEVEEERQQEQFLKGESIDETHQHSH